MAERLAGDLQRRNFWRVGPLVFSLAAVIGVIAAISPVSSAQVTTTNPTLEARCGLKVKLVLDESNSIRAFGATDTVREAATTFVQALEGTGSPLAISAFHSVARRGVPAAPAPGYQEVTPGNVSTFTNWIDNVTAGGYNPPTTVTGGTSTTPANGTTNWEDGFDQVGRTPDGPPDLVVFVTDGDPNTVNDPTAPGGRRFISNDEAGFNTAVGPAVTAANRVKASSANGGNGTRVFAIGVGPDVTNENSAGRIKRISGDTEGTNPITADYTLIQNFDGLRGELARIVARLCGSSLIIHKFVDNRDGLGWTPSGGWDFTAHLDPTPGHTWLEPDAGEARSATLTTEDSGEHVGRAAFHWRLHEDESTADLGVTDETVRPGFRFVLAQCETHHRDGSTTVLPPNTTEIPGATLGREEYHTCQVYNVRRVAHVTVIKRLVPYDDPGRFNLLIGDSVEAAGVGNGGTTGRVPVGLGRHTVSEEAAPGTNLADYSIRTICVNEFNGHTVADVHGPSASLDLQSEDDDIVCTITNTSTTHGILTVIKHLIPANDPGRFNLLVTQNGTTLGEEPNVGDGGSLGPLRLPLNGTYTVSEVAAPGTNLADYVINITCIDETTGHEVASATGPSVPVTLNSAHVQCTITNTHSPAPPVGQLTVVKHLVPSYDPGVFDLLIGGRAFALGVGHNGTTGPLDFELGTHKVSERITPSEAHLFSLSDYSISTTCVNADTHRQVASGKGTESAPVEVHLRNAGEHIVCTITNRRQAPPITPNGEPGATPTLFISKRMPARARVGGRVPITITVTNVSRQTVRNVLVHDIVPHGGRIVAVAGHRARRHGRTVVWNLGNLAPGETRTVHATLLVTRAGLHRDTALATSRNADPAFDAAAVRARGAVRQRRPNFTG